MKKNAPGALPKQIATIPTVDVVVFPHMVVPLLVLDYKIMNGIQEALQGEKKVLLLATRPPKNLADAENEPISIEDLYETGTIAEIIRVMELPEGGMKILVQGLSKASVNDIIPTKETLLADITPIEEEQNQLSPEQLEHYIKQIIQLIDTLPPNNVMFSPDFSVILSQIEDPYKVCDFILSHLHLSVEDAQELLEQKTLSASLDKILEHLSSIKTSSEVEETVRNSTRNSINQSQREYYLREQLRAIQKELGDDSDTEIQDYIKKSQTLKLDEDARTEVDRQISRLQKTAPDSLEATVLRNHIEWILQMPWGKYTQDNNNISQAKKVLNSEHFGLEEVKERILDFLSIKYLKEDCDTPILCLVGPPGVGKTSLGKSIAQCMGRAFARIALGGVHDEAEIRGHRRTYVGALPGRFIQAIKKAGSMNPLVLIDEIDKVGSSHKGDPSAALLEALDPEQNNTFYDNYLGIHFDFSRIIFIATANDTSTIPGPLRDRMEIIQLPGYTREEKLEIAKRHLILKVISRCGLDNTNISFSDKVINELINGYTREAGVRTLAQLLHKLCAKFARRYIEIKKGISFTVKNLSDYLGPRRCMDTELQTENKVGITNGLAWTPYGGEVLQVEAILMPGTGKLILTGQLGEVMKESAQAAMSYARSHAQRFNIDVKKFTEYDLHIHLPAGAIPKDGPSEGITLLASIFSVYTGRRINADYAMTGELNLQGNVLPIGGVKEKLLAAKQRGLSYVIFPKLNEHDIDAITSLPNDINVLFVNEVDEVLEHVLLPL